MATLYEKIINECEHDEISSKEQEHDGNTSRKMAIENYQKF